MTQYYIIEGVLAGQHPNIEEHFNKILSDFNRIIEIGTHRGGLTLYLFKNKTPNCELISYDIDPSLREVPESYKIDYRIGDCFETKTHDEIVALMTDPTKRVLLLCDGGNKEREFNDFSRYIKYNDVIMLHDYSDNMDDFRAFAKPIDWGDAGSFYHAILASIMKQNLQKYKYYNEFKSIFWGAFTKNLI